VEVTIALAAIWISFFIWSLKSTLEGIRESLRCIEQHQRKLASIVVDSEEDPRTK
jgi:hypothetical protein